MNFTGLTKFFKPYFWRLIFTLLGFITALSFLILGFKATMVILLCCNIGYIIGVFHDKNIHFLKWLHYWRNKLK